MSPRNASAWAEVNKLDKQIGKLVDNIPNQPKADLSAHQLEAAASHLRAAARLLTEVEKREVPLYKEARS